MHTLKFQNGVIFHNASMTGMVIAKPRPGHPFPLTAGRDDGIAVFHLASDTWAVSTDLRGEEYASGKPRPVEFWGDAEALYTLLDGDPRFSALCYKGALASLDPWNAHSLPHLKVAANLTAEAVHVCVESAINEEDFSALLGPVLVKTRNSQPMDTWRAVFGRLSPRVFDSVETLQKRLALLHLCGYPGLTPAVERLLVARWLVWHEDDAADFLMMGMDPDVIAYGVNEFNKLFF